MATSCPTQMPRGSHAEARVPELILETHMERFHHSQYQSCIIHSVKSQFFPSIHSLSRTLTCQGHGEVEANPN